MLHLGRSIFPRRRRVPQRVALDRGIDLLEPKTTVISSRPYHNCDALSLALKN
jgi:hypothetical protein